MKRRRRKKRMWTAAVSESWKQILKKKKKPLVCCMRTLTHMYKYTFIDFLHSSFLRPIRHRRTTTHRRTTQSVIKFIVVGRLLHIKQSSSHLKVRTRPAFVSNKSSYLSVMLCPFFSFAVCYWFWMDLPICAQHGLSTAAKHSSSMHKILNSGINENFNVASFRAIAMRCRT